MAVSNPDPLSLATAETIIPPNYGHKEYQVEKEKVSDGRGSTSDADVEIVAIDASGDIIKESDYTPEEYKKLLRKIDRYLLPLMVSCSYRIQPDDEVVVQRRPSPRLTRLQWFCYGIQQTDKTSLGTQAIFGLREDTHLKGQQYSWLTTIFYIAYLCGEFPSNFLLQRWSLGRALSLYMLCWGVSSPQVPRILMLKQFNEQC